MIDSKTTFRSIYKDSLHFAWCITYSGSNVNGRL